MTFCQIELVVKAFMLTILCRYSTVIHRRCELCLYIYIGITFSASTLPLVFNINTTSVVVSVAAVEENFLLHSRLH